MPIRDSAYTSSNAVFVRITAQVGTVGYGEACAWEPEFYGGTLESITSTIDRYLAPGLVGQGALSIHPVMAWVDARLARVTCV